MAATAGSQAVYCQGLVVGLPAKASRRPTAAKTMSLRFSSAARVRSSTRATSPTLRSSFLSVQLPQQAAARPQNPALSKSQGKKSLQVTAQAGRGGSIEPVDRVVAAAGYLLPFLDGARFGRFLYLQFPFVRAFLDPFAPLIQAYNGFPFAGTIAFFALYLAVGRNTGTFNRYVRYNVMQAILLDILIIVPSLLERLLLGGDSISVQIQITMYNTVFLYIVACFGFGVVSCILGRTPRLPLVADAAEAQVPF